MKKMLFSIVLLALCGCAGTPGGWAEHLTDDMLPPQATNVKSIGNWWFTFELEVEGKQRKFLCHVIPCVRNENHAITELRE